MHLGLISPPLRQKRRPPESRKVKLELRLGEIKEWLTEMAKTLAELDRVLGPVWSHEGALKDAIRETHGVSQNGRLVYSAAGSADRKPQFEELLQISMQWGGVKSQRRELGRRARGYEREVDQLRRELSRLAKQEGKQHGRQT